MGRTSSTISGFPCVECPKRTTTRMLHRQCAPSHKRRLRRLAPLKEAVISSLRAVFYAATALKASAPNSHKIKMSDGVFERWYRRHRFSIINRVSFSFSIYIASSPTKHATRSRNIFVVRRLAKLEPLAFLSCPHRTPIFADLLSEQNASSGQM
jgi:hypothetical protein